MVLIVPYRDRADHLKEFVAALGDKHEIVVVEQADDKPFNRGKLINVGYLETLPAVFVANDVDMIGNDAESYFPKDGINQLCTSSIQIRNYLGGSTMFDSVTFEYLQGYHNDYFHRAEDNEMMFRIKKMQKRIIHHKYKFTSLPHFRSGPEFIADLWEKAQLPRTVNMLKTCHYSVVSKEQMAGYILIKVLL